MSKVLDLGAARRHRQGVLPVLVRRGWNIERPEYKAVIEADGTIAFIWTTQSPTFRLAGEALRVFQRDLMVLGTWQRRVVEHLSGADRWVCRPTSPDGCYTVSHHKTERVFRPARLGARPPRRDGQARLARRCTACVRVLQVGETVWREADPKPWAHPNWREVRLCETCVKRPVSDGPTEIRSDEPPTPDPNAATARRHPGDATTKNGSEAVRPSRPQDGPFPCQQTATVEVSKET